MKQFRHLLALSLLACAVLLSGCQDNEPVNPGAETTSAPAAAEAEETATESLPSEAAPGTIEETSAGTEATETVTEAAETTETEDLEENQMDFARYAQDAQDALWSNQWNENKGYFSRDYPPMNVDHGYDYWWFAHSIDVLVDAYERTGDELYLERADKVMRGVYANNGNSLINNFFDDMDWMGLALLRLYDHTQNEEYLDHVRVLFEEIVSAWSEEGGGGLGWQKEKRHFKNTPTNAPAVILASRLYERTEEEQFQEWAHKIFDWMNETLRDPNTGYIYDGINDNQDNQLTRNAYTYNHGIYIGAAAELYRMTGDEQYLTWAEETYQNAHRVYLTPSNILKETGEGDGGLFKGILVRYITLYYYTLPEERTDIKDFILHNAESVANRSINDAGMISDNWSGPSKDQQHLSSHLSGVKLFEAAAKLQNEGHADNYYESYYQ